VALSFTHFIDTIIAQVNRLLGINLTAQGNLTNLTDYGRLHPDYGGLPHATIDAGMRSRLGPERGFAGPTGPGLGMAGYRRLLQDGTMRQPWSPMDMLPSAPGGRAPGAIGPMFPFGNFGPRAPSFNDRWQGAISPASPSSYAPGGAIAPGEGGRQKAFTVATNLNIDGRMLASMVSEHVIDMTSGASGAAADMFGPGSTQYSPS
jgi:hypothetical protein